MPQATAVVLLNAANKGENGDGFAIRFIPLILTLSHPGEGTLARYGTELME